jgi:hypothetical protein
MKAGRAFESVVADIVREFDSTPHVETNVIVDGPDGHREIDVLIDGSVSGIVRKAFIECKDYNPERGPLGIAVVDALESKRRDLNYDLCALCSNAGFTADAVRKAARTGIALFGALKDGDERIRYRVLDEIFVLKIDVENVSASVTLGANFRPIDLDLMRLQFGGLKVQAWLVDRVHKYLMSIRENGKGQHRLALQFSSPVPCEYDSEPIGLRQLSVDMYVVAQWHSQIVEHATTSGFYDWARRKIRMASGPQTMSYRNVNLDGAGKPIDAPNWDLGEQDDGVSVRLMSIGGVPAALGEKPDLDPYVDGDKTLTPFGMKL